MIANDQDLRLFLLYLIMYLIWTKANKQKSKQTSVTAYQVSLTGPLIDPGRKKRPLTESELEQRRQKRQEGAAKRTKLQEERKKQQQEELNYKK